MDMAASDTQATDGDGDDLMIRVDVCLASGNGKPIGELHRRVCIPAALAKMWLDDADRAAERWMTNELFPPMLTLMRCEVERRRPTRAFRRLPLPDLGDAILSPFRSSMDGTESTGNNSEE